MTLHSSRIKKNHGKYFWLDGDVNNIGLLFKQKLNLLVKNNKHKYLMVYQIHLPNTCMSLKHFD